MKTTRILISTALLALAATSFGQLGALKERVFPDKVEQVQVHNASFTSHSNHRESWMAIPFETEAAEEELYIESWMATPFEDLIIAAI